MAGKKHLWLINPYDDDSFFQWLFCLWKKMEQQFCTAVEKTKTNQPHTKGPSSDPRIAVSKFHHRFELSVFQWFLSSSLSVKKETQKTCKLTPSDGDHRVAVIQWFVAPARTPQMKRKIWLFIYHSRKNCCRKTPSCASSAFPRLLRCFFFHVFPNPVLPNPKKRQKCERKKCHRAHIKHRQTSH